MEDKLWKLKRQQKLRESKLGSISHQTETPCHLLQYFKFFVLVSDLGAIASMIPKIAPRCLDSLADKLVKIVESVFGFIYQIRSADY